MTLNKPEKYDKIILGAGIFGLYAALKSIEKGERVLVLEYDDAPFKRASYINQARVHNGYHYPRSYATAIKSVAYYNQFVADYEFAILKDFKQIYATSLQFSLTNQKQFEQFCTAANIPCTPISPSLYFQNGKCDGVFETLEYTFDAQIICKYLMDQLHKHPNFTLCLNTRIQQIAQQEDNYIVFSSQGSYRTNYLINATYASLNQILLQAGLAPFRMKYEICEIALCKVSAHLQNVGITLMDGPFFSLMPFGKTGFHSLTSVGNTPHLHSREILPTFKCQSEEVHCNPKQLGNCNSCVNKPKTAFATMHQLAKHYLKEEIEIYYEKSLFSMKTVLLSSEIDDSRPTVMKINHEIPKFLSIFSGKINTIYDLNEFI